VLALMSAGGVALLFAALAMPALIHWLVRNEIGQHIRDDGPATHAAKAGTPTMGGIVLIVAAVVGYLAGHINTAVEFSKPGLLAIITIVGFGGVGLLDDALKVRNKRNLGLNKRAKFAGQIFFGTGFAVAALTWAKTSSTLSFTRFDLPGWHLGPVLWGVVAVLIVIGASNAVNLTDGLDGLAAGSSTQSFAVLAIIGYWQFRHFPIYHLHAALDLALVAVAMAGAALGFLWWNAAPARIYMGDTGSLALGAALAVLCLTMNVMLLLVILGGLFVIETLSVIIQVASFRLFHRRVFKMAPIHHHFELKGWPETTVIVRFWILAALLAALGLGMFYADFLKVAKVV